MSYFVYILISTKTHNLYVGCTKSIEDRLKAHNSGKVYSTKLKRPWELLYLEKIEDKGEAFNRERFLKTLWSARFKAKLKKEYIQNRSCAIGATSKSSDGFDRPNILSDKMF